MLILHLNGPYVSGQSVFFGAGRTELLRSSVWIIPQKRLCVPIS